MESASEIIKRSIVIDALTGEATGFENMIAAGISAGNVTVGVDDDFLIEKLKSLWEQFLLLDSYPDKLMLIENATDIRHCKEHGKKETQSGVDLPQIGYLSNGVDLQRD
jgi:hypothetical protein